MSPAAQHRLTFCADAAAVSLVKSFIADFAAANALDSDERRRICILLEELVTNVVKYAYAGRAQPGDAEILLELVESRLTIEISDAGDPFDPLAQRPADFNLPIEQRRIGGLGLEIVRGLSEELHYHRIGERNVLRLTRRVSRASS